MKVSKNLGDPCGGHFCINKCTVHILLDHLPDEIQLKIFKFLAINDVICCVQVSKGMRRICKDESIWEKKIPL